MLEEYLVKKCAPSLAGIKSGNLFSCCCTDREEIYREIRDLNRKLSPKGLCIAPLKIWKNKVLVYVYRPKKLSADLSGDEACSLLKDAGYECRSCGMCVAKLMQRLSSEEGFPHEIGLFLSYPPEDVRGFIDNNAENYKFVGYWKVYGDAEKAKKTFAKYTHCTEVYCSLFEKGTSLEKLAVAI